MFVCGTPPPCLKVSDEFGGGPHDLSASPVPLGLIWVLNWVGLGVCPRGFGTKGLGPGLDNFIYLYNFSGAVLTIITNLEGAASRIVN